MFDYSTHRVSIRPCDLVGVGVALSEEVSHCGGGRLCSPLNSSYTQDVNSQFCPQHHVGLHAAVLPAMIDSWLNLRAISQPQ